MSPVPLPHQKTFDAKEDHVEVTSYATKATTQTRTDVDTKFTNIINGAPDALNKWKEVSDAHGANANSAQRFYTR